MEFKAMGRGAASSPSLRGSGVHENNDRNHASTEGPCLETPGGASLAASIDCGGVFAPDSTRKLAPPSPKRTLIVLAFVFCVAAFIAVRFSARLQGADFPHFYCAARMLADGHGHQLYDADLQRQYQARYAGRVGTLYTHPPFEAALYLAVAWLPLQYAYLVWSLLSMTFLALAAERLARDALEPWDWRILLAASLTFVPLLIGILQGQDSLLLLLLVVLAFTALRSERPFAAGCWLGFGLFKFQLALPLALVLVLTQSRARSGFVKGFSLTAAVLAAASIAISGWPVLTLYPSFLLHFKQQPLGGLVPQAMANFRGLTYLLFRSDQSFWAVAALSILCAAALIRTLTAWKQARPESPSPAVATRDEFDLAFANTVLFALLVSYHLNPQDLTLLLLPIALLLHGAWTQNPLRPPPASWMITAWLGILFLPPLHLWALRAGCYAVVGLPLLVLFLTLGSIERRGPPGSGVHQPSPSTPL
jgi:hypothetical protein